MRLQHGIVIWILANISIHDVTLFTYVANFFAPFGKLIGLDGYIITAFIMALPANEILLPIIVMGYLSKGNLIEISDINILKNILVQNGWTILTAINVMIFSLMHFPCGTTLLTIKKETNSIKWTIISFLLPTICGIVVCFITTRLYNLFI